jgi:hypothetical protein
MAAALLVKLKSKSNLQGKSREINGFGRVEARRSSLTTATTATARGTL